MKSLWLEQVSLLADKADKRIRWDTPKQAYKLDIWSPEATVELWITTSTVQLENMVAVIIRVIHLNPLSQRSQPLDGILIVIIICQLGKL